MLDDVLLWKRLMNWPSTVYPLKIRSKRRWFPTGRGRQVLLLIGLGVLQPHRPGREAVAAAASRHERRQQRPPRDGHSDLVAGRGGGGGGTAAPVAAFTLNCGMEGKKLSLE